MSNQVTVDFVGDFHTGKYLVEDVAELKRQVAARLDRQDINWNNYTLMVGEQPVDDTFKPEEGSVIKAYAKGIKGGL